jgi:hypothetical protein
LSSSADLERGQFRHVTSGLTNSATIRRNSLPRLHCAIRGRLYLSAVSVWKWLKRAKWGLHKKTLT